LAFRPPGAAGYWNCRWLLDRCGDAPLDIWLAPAHRCSQTQCVHAPQRGIELTFWIALSVTAGICAETIFRGYLQRQFMALTKSAPGGILLSAATFGAAHAYQGFRMVIPIGLYGATFGILTYWRGSVRPGMIAHAWNDSLKGVLAVLGAH
jgi:membrane protease YdiL (CAAX protease family)